MEQIVDYKNIRNGYTNSLLCFMQCFVSNESATRYFANNRNQHFSFNAEERFCPSTSTAEKKTTKSPLCTTSRHFYEKCSLGRLISRYMVWCRVNKNSSLMRPYQIYAVKEIVRCIHENAATLYLDTPHGKTAHPRSSLPLPEDTPI